MDTLSMFLAIAWLFTLALLIRSLFRQAGIQDALQESSDTAADQMKLWEEFAQHLDEGVALLNEKDQVVYANEPFANLSGWQGRSSFNNPLETVLHLQNDQAEPAKLPESRPALLSVI